jgi:hypothetical protein
VVTVTIYAKLFLPPLAGLISSVYFMLAAVPLPMRWNPYNEPELVLQHVLNKHEPVIGVELIFGEFHDEAEEERIQ